jgi:hypothetical protein
MPPAQPEASVQQIGDALMHRFVLPLEIMGLLLTAALIGAVVPDLNANSVEAAAKSIRGTARSMGIEVTA